MYKHGEEYPSCQTLMQLIPLQLVRWQIVAAIDIATEVVLVCLAVYLVHDLKMKIMNKAVVVLAFFFRLPYVHTPHYSLILQGP